MFLIKICYKPVLAEDLFVVSLGDTDEVIKFGLNLGIPVLVIVQKLRVQIVRKQGATGGPDMARFIGFDGKDVAALFVTV